MRLRVAALALTGLVASRAGAASYELKATPETVVVGYYWSEAKPVLKIQSGDTVKIQTATAVRLRDHGQGSLQQMALEAFDRIGKEVKDHGHWRSHA